MSSAAALAGLPRSEVLEQKLWSGVSANLGARSDLGPLECKPPPPAFPPTVVWSSLVHVPQPTDCTLRLEHGKLRLVRGDDDDGDSDGDGGDVG